MNRLFCFSISIGLILAACSGADSSDNTGDCDGGTCLPGAHLTVDAHTQTLCAVTVSGEQESRCDSADQCTGQTELCAFPIKSAPGYCRQCAIDNQCPNRDMRCDSGWCHLKCVEDDDCPERFLCTTGLCRPAVPLDFALSNKGSETLTIDPTQVALLGLRDACAFSRMEFEGAKGPFSLQSGASIILRVFFSPTEAGDHRAKVQIPSHDPNSPVELMLCARAVKAVCDEAVDGACPDCMACEPADFQDLPALTQCL